MKAELPKRVKCQEGIHVFAVYVWHSEGWSVRTEELMKAVLRRVTNTKNLWIIVLTPIWNRVIFSLAIGHRRRWRQVSPLMAPRMLAGKC